ncbi:hypothetical protein [Pseudomonas coleopterorum]|uniref:hypothetical protein n=1 Tax=Pseudomonas coleopterorum TaxID=1605838 RepID=UPI001784A438|nr:hypothetical protein [Pseudomonas coleopterorum]MBD8483891.1 hypothetical protein [Pseudomonas coleopterorum]
MSDGEEDVGSWIVLELRVAGARFMLLDGLRVVLAWGCAVLAAGAVFTVEPPPPAPAGLDALSPVAAPTPHEADKSMPITPLYFRARKSVFMGIYLWL